MPVGEVEKAVGADDGEEISCRALSVQGLQGIDRVVG